MLETSLARNFSGHFPAVFSHGLTRTFSGHVKSWVGGKTSRESTELLIQTFGFFHTALLENVRKMSGLQCMSESSYCVEKSADSHRDIGECCPHHEVVGPGLQLKDVGWRKHHPNGGQDEEEDRREEGQEGFVQVAVLQSVTAISPETPQGEKSSERWVKTILQYNETLMKTELTSGHCRGSWVRSQWKSKLEINKHWLV